MDNESNAIPEEMTNAEVETLTKNIGKMIDAKLEAQSKYIDAKIDAKLEAQSKYIDAKIDAKLEAQSKHIDAKFESYDIKLKSLEKHIDSKFNLLLLGISAILGAFVFFINTTNAHNEQIQGAVQSQITILTKYIDAKTQSIDSLPTKDKVELMIQESK